MTDRYETARTQWTQDVRIIANDVTTTYQDARRLLVGGTWLPGPFRFAAGTWINTTGIVVDHDQVQARELGGDARTSWDTILNVEPAPDCETSGAQVDPTNPDHPLHDNNQGELVYWCHVHESDVPTWSDAFGDRYIATHDTRGRLLD